MLAELRLTPVEAEMPFALLVADVVPILAESPLQYQIHAMGTTLEGDLEAILDVVRRCHELLRKHAARVLIELSIDDRAVPEGELVRSLKHLRELSLETPLERFVHASPRGRRQA
jgi:uncharacterized protein (TIGR00106 family)